MTFNEKILLAIQLVHQDYSKIITPTAGAVYLKLLLLNKSLLDSRDSKNTPSISFDQITSSMNISIEEAVAAVKLLDTFGFVSMLSRKPAVYVNNPRELSYEESISLIEILVENGIIKQDQKQIHIDAIRIPVQKVSEQPKPKRVMLGPISYDFSNADSLPVKIKKYTTSDATAVVDHYYEKLSKTFGGKYASPAKVRETAVIKAHMNKFDDSPEITIKMLDYMIEKAKNIENFDRVKNMSGYGWKRNEIFQKIFNNVAVSPTQVNKMDNVKTLYRIYTDDGMAHTEAINELRMAFGDELIKQFEDGLNGE